MPLFDKVVLWIFLLFGVLAMATNIECLQILGGLTIIAVIALYHRYRMEQPVPPPRPMNGTIPPGRVYLLRAGPYYKIGKAGQFERRLNQIRLQLPYPVEVIHTIAAHDISRTETYWHRRFKRKRVNGEWFTLSEADVAEFTSHEIM